MSSVDLLRQMKTKVGQKIYSSIGEDGGAIGVAGAMADPLTTAEMMYCLHVNGLYYPKKMVKWLEQLQDTTGKWTTYSEDAWEVSITSWVLLALSCIDEKNEEAMLRAVKWLLMKQGTDGVFFQSDTQTDENTYATAYACLALYSIDAVKYECQVKAGIEWLKKVQNSDGGFGLRPYEDSEASLTAYVAHFIGKVDNKYGDVEDMKKCMTNYLLNVQNPSGAWTSWFELSDSIEGTCFVLFSLLGLSYKNTAIFEKACQFINLNLDLKTLDNWIASSLLHLIVSLDRMVVDTLV